MQGVHRQRRHVGLLVAHGHCRRAPAPAGVTGKPHATHSASCTAQSVTVTAMSVPMCQLRPRQHSCLPTCQLRPRQHSCPQVPPCHVPPSGGANVTARAHLPSSSGARATQNFTHAAPHSASRTTFECRNATSRCRRCRLTVEGPFGTLLFIMGATCAGLLWTTFEYAVMSLPLAPADAGRGSRTYPAHSGCMRWHAERAEVCTVDACRAILSPCCFRTRTASI